jgi:tetratricopeptide (TPR) repeat protein
MNAPDANSKRDPARSRAFDPDLSAGEFEMQFFDRVLQRHPLYVDVLRRQAENLSRAGRYPELLDLDRRLVEVRPQDPVIHYNLACTLSRMGDLTASIASLRSAIRLGYDDLGHIETDPDLDAVRDLPEFRALLKRRKTRRRR